MSQIRTALSMMIGLVSPVALVLVGAVAALALFHGERADQKEQALPAHIGRVYVGEEDEILHVDLNIEKAKDCRTLLIHGSPGKELAKFYIHRGGGFGFGSARDDPFGIAIDRRPDGSSSMGARAGRGLLILDVRNDGSSQIRYEENGGKTLQVLRLDTKGGILSSANSDLISASPPSDE